MSYALKQDDTIFILMSYIVIIPSYLIVVSKAQGMCKIGAYLKIFHEGEEFNWESRRIMYQEKSEKNIFKYIISMNFPFIFVNISVGILYLYFTPWDCPLPYSFIKING